MGIAGTFGASSSIFDIAPVQCEEKSDSNHDRLAMGDLLTFSSFADAMAKGRNAVKSTFSIEGGG